MRNLKKILALVMALVMSMSLITIANASDFTDSSDITYEEAADVMSAIGVIEGFEDGSFDPDGTLTREQAAKLVTFMLLGDNANNLGIESSSFNDVAATRWSAPAIEYCYSLGLIDGAGDGNFYPAGQLTGVAFAKVLLTALGYSSEKEQMTGPTWHVNVAALAMEVGLDDGIENLAWNSVITREEAAQMALNAICAPLVAYESGVTVMVGDTPVSFGSGDAYYVTTTIAREQRISDRRLTNASSTTPNYTVEFGERYFPLLRLDTEADDFNRPSHTWVYENVELGTYVDYDLLVETYTAGVSNRDLYDLLGRSNLEDYEFEYYVDGVDNTASYSNATILKRNNDDFGYTGTGVLTQVFVDHEWDNAHGRIVITSINTWLAKVTAGYNETSEDATLTIYADYNGSTNKTEEYSKVVNSADVDGVTNLVKDQYVLVNMTGKNQTNSVTGAAADVEEEQYYRVVKISDVEILTDSTITKYSKGSNSDWQSDTNQALFKSVTSGGVEYKGAAQAVYSDEVLDLYNNNLLTGNTYNIYLDTYGNAIGVDLYAGQDNYVFITGYDVNGSAIANATATAAAIFLDGTVRSISVNVSDTNKNITRANDYPNADVKDGEDYFSTWTSDNPTVNRWYTYTVDANNVYTLNPATRMFTTAATSTTPMTIQCNNVVLDRTKVSVGGNSSTAHYDYPTTIVDKDIRAYGNDNSVYIVAKLGTVGAISEPGRKVITGVDGLYTGVQNVEIELEYKTGTDTGYVGSIELNGKTGTDANTTLFDMAYTLYDKDNYIIASVVVGEAKGTNANYAYVLTAAKSEEIRDGKYYWTFDAVLDGKIQTLTVESEFASTINALRPGHVQELRFNGDYVTDVENIPDNEFYDDYTKQIQAGDETVYEFGHKPGDSTYECTDSHSTWAYASEYDHRLDAANLHAIGRTLYLGNGDYGLTFVSEDVPVVVIQPVDRWSNKVKTEYTSLSAALASLGDADDTTPGLQFKGRLTAVLDSRGVAEWLVINSDTTIYTAPGGTVRPDSRTMTVNVTMVGMSGTYPVTLGYQTYTVTNGQDIYPTAAFGNWKNPSPSPIHVGTNPTDEIQFKAGTTVSYTVTYTWMP